MGTWYDLPVDRSVSAEIQSWDSTDVPGFFRRLWHQEHGSNLYEAGLFKDRFP